ncbi:phosphate signaling complex protein PhoU [Dictyobacter kobayashii]|uniref:Phosphate-specific transport system accessory protein PhoU n=1 Tax=Dictyobacter kobayashii TaxID=2014872 RepID=A0A402AFR8_9CHLR|nr:phosphate signaling complex protein PhoU [Dictyobacter kobayashii]GCE17968.1 phosphate transport system regulatory protein PhoU [Dictyobacter kobayashii]
MARSTLDKELLELDSQIQHLGTLVDEALEKSLDALATGDLAQAGMVIEADSTIDSVRKTVEEHAIRLLTMQQPLGGRDLRYLTSALAIAGDLERAGDGAAGIAQILLRMAPLRTGEGVVSTTTVGDTQVSEASALRGILELGREARRVLQGTMKAFADRDVRAARYIWEEDDVVDVRYHLVRHDLMAMMAGAHAIPTLQHDGKALQRVTYLLWIAHKLERVADHCTNVCERLVFTIEGENEIVASSDKQQ